MSEAICGAGRPACPSLTAGYKVRASFLRASHHSPRFQPTQTISARLSAIAEPNRKRREVHYRDPGAEADQAPEAVRNHGRGRRPANAGMQDQHHADEYQRNQRDDAADRRADPALERDDRGHQCRHQRRAQRNIVPAPCNQRHLDVTKAPDQRQAYRKRNGVGDDGAEKR